MKTCAFLCVIFLTSMHANAQNVGIGTNIPFSKLQVNSSGYGILHSDLTNNVQVGTYVSTLGGWLGTRSNHNLHFFTKNSNPLVTLDTLGRLGIGTQSPLYILDVNGRLRIRNNGNTAGVWLNKADNTESTFTGMFNDTTYGFFGNGNWRIGFDTKNSLVGIGVMDPSAPLSFSSTIGNKIALWGDAAGGHYGLGIQGSLLQMYSSASNADIALGYGSSTAFNENMRVKGNGNVGIGTNNPTAKLEVAGSVKIVDGTQGAGKVLTSNAAGTGTWANAAFGNTERFQFRLTSFNGPFSLTTLYNMGTATASYTAGQEEFSINITKAGLYHFDINGHQLSNSDVTPNSAAPNPQLLYSTLNGTIIYKGYVPAVKLGSSSYTSYDKTIEVYVPAGSTFTTFMFKIPPVNTEYRLVVTGHLMLE